MVVRDDENAEGVEEEGVEEEEDAEENLEEEFPSPCLNVRSWSSML